MKHKMAIAVAVGALVALGAAWEAGAQKLTKAQEQKFTFGEKKSDYLVSTPATRAIQDDDFQNGSFLWVDIGEQEWSKVDGKAGKACVNCHGDAAKTMKGVGAAYPVFDKKLGRVVNVEQRINNCRVANMQAKPWKWESDQLLGMTAYVKLQSRGMPLNVKLDSPEAKAAYEKGKAFYNQRRGQFDMACANCHLGNEGNYVRADLLGQGRPNGFPQYRLKWQKIGSLHRRFKGCNRQVRATPYKSGSEEYTNLELFITYQANGLKVETPAVRR